MTDASSYTSSKAWTLKKKSTGNFANINTVRARARHEKDLPIGRHP